MVLNLALNEVPHTSTHPDSGHMGKQGITSIEYGPFQSPFRKYCTYVQY